MKSVPHRGSGWVLSPKSKHDCLRTHPLGGTDLVALDLAVVRLDQGLPSCYSGAFRALLCRIKIGLPTIRWQPFKILSPREELSSEDQTHTKSDLANAL